MRSPRGREPPPQQARVTGWLVAACFIASCARATPTEPQRHTIDSSGADCDPPLIELFSWWTAPGEAEALQTLVDSHTRKCPNARVFNAAAASGTSAKDILVNRLAHDDPPDLYQENVHDLRQYVKTHPGKFVQLDSIFDELALRRSVYPEVLEDVTIQGHIYALPVNLHRENSLIYNKRLFEKFHLLPPQSVDELLSDCEILKRGGVVPIATANQGWILRIMFHSVAMGVMGTTHYHEYFTGRTRADDPSLTRAIDTFARIVENYTNSDAAEEGYNWTNAAQAVFNGEAAMFMHGDWAKGYLVQLGWRPGLDFGVVGAAGAADLFLYGVDVFAMPVGSRNEIGARELLKTIAAKQAQIEFSRFKGSSPMRQDVEPDFFDPIGRTTLSDLKNAKVRMVVHNRQPWDDAMTQFARDHDRTALKQAFIENPPQ